MGVLQTEEPLRDKVPIWPALMIGSSTSTFASGSLSESTPQTHSDPAVYPFEDPRRTTVLEVHEPASKRPVDSVDDELHRVPRASFRLLAQRVLELLQALLARDSCIPLEEVSQEGKAFLAGVHNLRFGRVQR